MTANKRHAIDVAAVPTAVKGVYSKSKRRSSGKKRTHEPHKGNVGDEETDEEVAKDARYTHRQDPQDGFERREADVVLVIKLSRTWSVMENVPVQQRTFTCIQKTHARKQLHSKAAMAIIAANPPFPRFQIDIFINGGGVRIE